MKLGPHVLHYLDEADVEQDINIVFEIKDATRTLDDGYVDVQLAGTATISSSIYNREFTIMGDNEIQLVCRLIRIAGIDLLRVARDGEFDIYQFDELDVESEYDLFF